jgi:glycosyltransferase involved in cell wall biosynthesis
MVCAEYRERPTLTVVCPSFHAGGSGSSVYYPLLAGTLASAGWKVSVVSDEERGSFAGTYHPLFPARTGRNRRPVRDRLAFLLENARYLGLGGILRRERTECLLVHYSFCKNPGIFEPVLRVLRRQRPGMRLVADVRSPTMSRRSVRRLSMFDGVIACSENSAAHLVANGLSASGVRTIPVIQEPLHHRDLRVPENRPGGPVIFYAGRVKEEKRTDILLEAFVHHVRKRVPDATLVIAGVCKTRRRRVLRLLESPGVEHLGLLDRKEVLGWMSIADLCVNLSGIEGMPRSSLEALALGRRVLLPPNVPEFDRHCGDFVARDLSPRGVGETIVGALRSDRRAVYPVENHAPERVLSMYEKILRGEELLS